MVLIFGDQSFRGVVQRYTHGDRSVLFSLSGNILHRIVNNASVGHFIQVADTTTDKALKYENISLCLYLLIIRHIGFVLHY